MAYSSRIIQNIKVIRLYCRKCRKYLEFTDYVNVAIINGIKHACPPCKVSYTVTGVRNGQKVKHTLAIV